LNEVEIAVIDRILSHDYMTVQFLLKILLEFSDILFYSNIFLVLS